MSTSPADLVDMAVKLAPRTCAFIAIAEVEQRANLRWAQNSLTTNGLTTSLTLTLIAVVDDPAGRRTATQTLTNVEPELLPHWVATLCEQAAGSEISAMDGFEDLVDAGISPEFLDLPQTMTPEVFSPIIDPLARGLTAAHDAGLTWSGYAQATLDSTWLATSAGTRRVHHQPAASIEITQRQTRADGVINSSWAARSADYFDLINVDELSHQLQQSQPWGQIDVVVEPGRHTVILTAEAVADLAIPVLWETSAREALEGSSVFSSADGGTKIASRVMGNGISISSDPHHELVATAPFVVEHSSGPSSSVLDNGVALEKTNWIDDGVLEHLMGPRSLSGRLEQTRPHVDNVVIQAQGSGSLADLIARADDGILITCLWYIRDVDRQTLLLTGLTRDGVYVIKNGQIVGAASNFRFNVSPLDVLSNVIDSTSSTRIHPREWGEYIQRVVAPAITTTGFNLSTVSDAR